MAAVNKMDSKRSLSGDSDYKNQLVKRLFELQQCNVFTDVVIVVGNSKFNCHKIILAAASDVFASMFDVDMREKVQGVVYLSELDVKESTFNNFLKYIYTGQIIITLENVEEVLVISNFLLVHKLRSKCFEFLAKTLSISNCLNIAVVAERFGEEKLQFKAQKIIFENFVSISSQRGFTELDFLDLKSILSNDNLEIPNEDRVLLCCIDWLNHDFESRKKKFSKLIKSCVRIKFLSASHSALLEQINENFFLGKLSYLNDTSLDQVKPRACLDTLSAVIVTGGYDGNKCLMSSFVFSPGERQWGNMAPMKISRHDHGTAVFKNLLVVVGGFNTIFGPLESVECFNSIRNEWFEMPSMTTKRKSHAVCIYDQYLIASGGLDGNYNVLSSVEYFDGQNQRWEQFSPMIQGRYTHGLVANNNSLFAIGGWKTSSCEIYDGTHWAMMAPMKTQRAGASCSIYNNNIYVYGGYSNEDCLSSLEIFDIKHGFWTVGESSKVSRWRAGSTIIDKYIYVIGGRDSAWEYLDSVEIYSIENGAWDKQESLPFKVMGLKCCVVDIPRKILKKKK